MTTTLVTGATGGLGKAFARAFAAQGCDVILVARREQTLKDLATELHSDYGITATVFVADLTVTEDRDRLLAAHPAIDVLINNAGFGDVGHRFDAMDPARVTDMVTLNCTALADLSRRYLPTLLERTGALVNVASIAGFQPLPGWSLYAATKAFVLSFTQALAIEFADSPVTITCLCPGATQTEFFDVAGASATMPQRRSPEQVVQTCLDALAHGKPVVVDGLANAITATAGKHAPFGLIKALARHIPGNPR